MWHRQFEFDFAQPGANARIQNGSCRATDSHGDWMYWRSRLTGLAESAIAVLNGALTTR